MTAGFHLGEWLLDDNDVIGPAKGRLHLGCGLVVSGVVTSTQPARQAAA